MYKVEDLYSKYGPIDCIKRELLSSAENAVSIGFYLNEIDRYNYWQLSEKFISFKSEKYTTNNGIVKFTKYTFYNFCKDEFNFSRRSVDRYLNIFISFSMINDCGVRTRFIDKRYINYTSSQLSEMLYLNDRQLKCVNSDMTVKDIRKLKNDNFEVPVVPDQEEPEGIFLNKDSSIEPGEVDVVFDKDFEDKTFKKKKYSVCGLMYDKFVSTPAQYTQQFIKLQEFLNQGYLARIVLYSPVEEKKDGEEIA